jgi:hypothetical protein
VYKNSWLEIPISKPKVIAENQRISKEAEKEVDIDAHLEDRVKWEQEKAKRRKAWEAQRKADAEQRERQEKRSRLEAHVKARSEAWRDHTGSEPTTGQVTRWREEYLSQIVAAEEWELEARRAQAEDIAAGN